MKRPIMTPEIISHFSRPGGENWTFDFRDQLAFISCPTLVTAGDIDPITPIEAVQEMVDHIPKEYLTMEIFPDCGHGVHRDEPRAFTVMKKFITG